MTTIAYTGPTGSIGSQMPPGHVALHTRLEASVEERIDELRRTGAAGLPLIHLAGLVPVGACEADPQLAHRLNVIGSRLWYEAAVRTGCPHFVFVSSAHVFAASPAGRPMDVDSPVAPRSVYARTKLEAEQALEALAGQSPQTRLTVARVFGVLSRAMRPGYLFTRLHERAATRDFSPIPGLSNVRDFMDAADIAARLVKLAQTPAPPPRVLICSGRPMTVREVAERVFRDHGLDPSNLTEAPGRPDDIPYLVGTPTDF